MFTVQRCDLQRIGVDRSDALGNLRRIRIRHIRQTLINSLKPVDYKLRTASNA